MVINTTTQKPTVFTAPKLLPLWRHSCFADYSYRPNASCPCVDLPRYSAVEIVRIIVIIIIITKKCVWETLKGWTDMTPQRSSADWARTTMLHTSGGMWYSKYDGSAGDTWIVVSLDELLWQCNETRNIVKLTNMWSTVKQFNFEIMPKSAEKFGGSTVIWQWVPDRRSANAERFHWQC